MKSHALWMLTAAFIVHDGEEVLTMPGWIESHQSVLNGLGEANRLAALALRNLPRSTAEVTVAAGVELLVIVAATFAATRRPHGASLFLYATLLGLFSLHALTHYGLAFFFRGYTPGLITAVLA